MTGVKSATKRTAGHFADSYSTMKHLTSSVLVLCQCVMNDFHTKQLSERDGEPPLHSSQCFVITVRYVERQTEQMEEK